MSALSAVVVVASLGMGGCVIATQTHYPDYRPPVVVQSYCPPAYYPPARVYYPVYYPHHHEHHHGYRY
ncbi:MAG: hypothetical protein K0U21_01615 [Proteobacteria bacterium]|nr:hypothetical protein [Pseudomonadota bacterium]